MNTTADKKEMRERANENTEETKRKLNERANANGRHIKKRNMKGKSL